MSICLWYFHFKMVHGLTPLIVLFAGFSDVLPFEPLEFLLYLLRLWLLVYPRRASLEHPWCFLVSSSSYSSVLFFSLKAPLRLLLAFSVTIAWLVLIFLWCSFLVHCGRSLTVLINSLFLSAILFTRISQRPLKPLGPSLLVWDIVLYSPYLSNFRLNNWLACSRLLWKSFWLIFLPAIAVEIPSNRLIGSLGQNTWRTPFLILFDCPLLMPM